MKPIKLTLSMLFVLALGATFTAQSYAQTQSPNSKTANRQAEEDRKDQKKKEKEDAKLKKEFGPDDISSSYDKYGDKSVVLFNSLMFDKIWDNGTALILGAEFNIEGNDVWSNQKKGHYFVTLTYIINRIGPLPSHSLIFLADNQRLVFDNLRISKYSAPSSEGILAKGVVVHTYQEVPREVLTKIADAKIIEARFNDLEFVVKPRYANTMREFLTKVP